MAAEEEKTTDLDFLFYLRASGIGRVPVPEIKELMKTFPSFAEEILNKPKEEILDELRTLRDKIIDTRGSRPSLPCLCAVFIYKEVGIPTEELALMNASDGNLIMAGFWQDISWGTRHITGNIFEGEDALKGLTEENATESTIFAVEKVEEISDCVIPLTESTELYLEIKKDHRQNEELFKKDSSGMLLVDFTVEQVIKEVEKDDPVIPAPVPEFVVAGATLAQKMYKKIYPIGLKLYQSQI